MPPKKVGPAVPPKPKKPQPQVPKSYQLSSSCEPSYSAPLQSAVLDNKRPGSSSGPVYSNVLPVSDRGDNTYSNIGPAMPMQHLYSNLEPYTKTHLIEDPDAFKTWLSLEVKSMIDADPVALAKYIYALVKKNKPLDEVREKAISQLEVFFKEKTVSFVDMLFQSIATKSYLAFKTNVDVVDVDVAKPPIPVTNSTEALENSETASPAKLESEPKEDSLAVKETRETTPISKVDKFESSVVRKLDPNVTPPKRRRQSVSPNVTPPKRRRQSVSPRCKYRWSKSRSPRSRSRSKSRSRSVSWEKRVKYRRSPRKNQGMFRHRRFSSDRKYSSRRRSLSRSISRSPFRSRSRSRSRSFSPRKSKYRHRNPSPLSPLFRKASRDEKLRFSPNLSSRKPIFNPDTLSLGTGTPAISMPKLNYMPKQRCIDYDEKGFCMRGDMCAFDHGVNPVVLEPSSVPLLPVLQPSAAVTHPNPNSKAFLNFEGSQEPTQYNPNSLRTNFANWNLQKNKTESRQGDSRLEESADVENVKKPRPHVFSRLGPQPVKDKNVENTLEIRNIPPKLNTITLLFNHFSKFGNVVNIKVNHDDDPSAAILTYSNIHEAIAALRSPEPVMRNRFIKVSWLGEAPDDDKIEKEENVPPKVVKTVQSKLGISVNKVPKAASFPPKTLNLFEGKKKINKAPVPKRKKIVKEITSNLLKLRQGILEEQIEKQKLLIEKLEKGQYSSEDKISILSTIKMLDSNIKEIKNSLASSVNKLKAENSAIQLANLSPAEKKTKLTDLKRELLDAELDLFNAQQKGSDVSSAENKVLSLKKQIMMLSDGAPTTAPVGRRPVPLLPKVGSLSVDHRPTKLQILDFDVKIKAAIISHLTKFGELKIEQENDDVPSLVLSFKSHKDADLALNKGKQFFGDKISISFCN